MSKNNKEEKIIKQINRCINDLVYEKHKLIKAYNYYNGKRDPEQFRHLEENYGIGTATSMEFIPLVRKHIDILIGEYLSTPIIPKISCKDQGTLSNINRDKQLAINKSILDGLNKHLKNAIYTAINADPQNPQQPITDKEIEAEIKKVIEATDRNFISEYEIAGQNIIQYLMQSRGIDFINKLKIILTDLLITGTCYYKVDISGGEENIDFRVLNPLNTFVDRNPYSPYLKDSYRSVIREYLTKHQILAKYGHLINKEDLDELDSMEDLAVDGSTTTYLRSFDSVVGAPVTDGILGGFEITPLLPYERNTSKYFRVFPVYEAEWIESEKGDDGKYTMIRNEGVRIGTNVYIAIGESKTMIRSKDNPRVCSLALNGTFYSDRNGDPFSLILATANLQDKYDCLHFHRDNIIAQSGVSGDWVDLAFVPKLLGDDLTERLQKWTAYAKGGKKLLDSSQEGMPMNTTFGGFDDSVKLNAIQAIELAIQRTEETCSSITGVFRERLGGIEQKDAVTNVQTGIKNSALITKQYYQLMDLMTREVLLDSLNLAKIVFKNGITGNIILGERLNKIFTALPEHFTLTDHDVHIADSQTSIKEQTSIEQLQIEFIKGGLIDPEVIIDMVGMKSLTDMKLSVKNGMAKKREENNQLQQATQQAQQLQEELKKIQQENQKLQQQIQKTNDIKTQMDQERLAFDKELGWYKENNLKEYNEAKMEWEQKRIQLEAAEMFDNNPHNDVVKKD